MTNILSLFVPINKIDEAQRLVYGTLTQEVADKSGEIFDYDSGKDAIKSWSDEISESTNGKSLGNVRSMHQAIAAGKFTDIVYDDASKSIQGVAKVVDDGEWEKVLEGVYTGFSIGGGYAKRWPDTDNPGLMRYTPTISEISLVDNPCVPTATFEYIKADGSSELRKFKLHKEEPMTNAPLQKWQASDGSVFDTQEEAAAHEVTIVAKGAAAPLLDAISAVQKTVDGAVGKEGDKPAAEPVAKAEGDPAPATQETPAVEKTDTTVTLKKDLWGLANFADLLQSVLYQYNDAKWQDLMADDSSEMPDKLKVWLKDGMKILKEMVTEVTAEIFDEAEVEKLAPAPASALAKFITANNLPLQKADSPELANLTTLVQSLEKAGAKHSKATKDELMGLHKSASDHVEAIEKCFKGMGIMADDAADDNDAKKILKFLEAEKLEKAAALSQNEALVKVVTEATEAVKTLEKSFADKVSVLQGEIVSHQKEIEVLKAQPMPGKGQLRAVNKGESTGGDAISQANEALAKMSPEQRANELMKLALANPVIHS